MESRITGNPTPQLLSLEAILRRAKQPTQANPNTATTQAPQMGSLAPKTILASPEAKVPTLLPKASALHKISLLSQAQADFGVKMADFSSKNGAPISVMTVNPLLTEIRPIYSDGLHTLTPNQVRQMSNLKGAINGPLFGMKPGTKTMGDLMAPGQKTYDDGYQYTHQTYHLGITHNGKIEISKGGLSKDSAQKYRSFTGGMQHIFSQIDPKTNQPMIDFQSAGINVGPTDKKAARTLLGVDKNGMLLLVTIGSGNLGHKVGADIQEAAQIMHRLGAVKAFNFDGGGSTQMIVPGSKLPLASSTRPVKAYLGIFNRQ